MLEIIKIKDREDEAYGGREMRLREEGVCFPLQATSIPGSSASVVPDK
jgi:hypothetical protein